MRPLLIALLASAALSACAAGPDYRRPALPQADAPDYRRVQAELNAAPDARPAPAASPAPVMNQAVSADWWTTFQSPVLNRLIEAAHKANPTVEAATAALRQAQEQARVETGALWPQVGLTAGGARQRDGAGARNVYTLYNASVGVAYDPDLFGGQRRRGEGARAEAEARAFELGAAYAALDANVATTAIQAAALRRQITLSDEAIAAQQRLLSILKDRLQVGEGSPSDVAQQEALLAQTQADAPALAKALAERRNQLAVYLGRAPRDLDDDVLALEDLHLPQQVPVSLPATLLEQRPDIRAAEARLKAANAEIGVATAALLPQVLISGAYGGNAGKVSQLFDGPGLAWSLAGAVTQSVFDGGQRRHQRRAAQAGYDEAAAAYRGVALNAFKDVADVLYALDFDAQTLGARRAASQAARRSFDLAQTRYRDGGEGFVTVLTSQDASLRAQMAEAQAQAQQLADVVALYQALGGGWTPR
ncbi:MAG: efflux transporter outer membrane subunit [Caulobacter sp.]|nr:efflux transporter outer membrane subunit [Caulobacter sp.]